MHPAATAWLVVGVLAVITGGTVALVYAKGAALVTFTLSQGVVTQPVELIRHHVSGKYGASVSNGVLALATCITSEGGSLPTVGQTAIGFAILNRATGGKPREYDRQTRESKVFALLAPDGKFGEQKSGRYAATSRGPTRYAVDLANAILAGTITDPTHGAQQWDSPNAQRALLKRRPDIYTKTPEQVAAARRADGRRLVTLPGMDTDRIRFWA